MLTTEFPYLSDTQLKLEQTAEMSRRMYRPVELGWEVRKKLYSVFLPLGLFSSFCLFEIMFFKTATGKGGSPMAAALSGLVVLGLHLLLVEFLLRFRRARARSLEFVKKGLRLSPLKQGLVPWKQVRAITIEPAEGDDRPLRKLTVFYGSTKPSRQHEWSIAIATPEEAEVLAKKFRGRIDSGQLEKCEVTVHDRPRPPMPDKPGMNTFFYLLGMLFFLHGFAPLWIGLERRGEGRMPAASAAAKALEAESKVDVLDENTVAGKLVIKGLVAAHRAFPKATIYELFIGFGSVMMFFMVLSFGSTWVLFLRDERRWMEEYRKRVAA